MAALTTSHTYSGIAFDFASPRSDMIDLQDIGRGLNGALRFNGHLTKRWTVLQHSILVSILTAMKTPKWRAEGVLHDSSEAYTGDCPGPLKKILGEAYKAIERPIEQAIAIKFNLEYPWPAEIKQADMLAQDIEAAMMHPAASQIIRQDFVLQKYQERLVESLIDYGAQDFIQYTTALLEERNYTDLKTVGFMRN